MTAKELYSATKKMYDAVPEAAEWFGLRALMGELWFKYGADYMEHIANPDREIDFSDSFIADAKKALSGYPLQYITGKVAFWNGEFRVGEGVLVPRDDTERLVELALDRVEAGDIVYDLCCGSGCIGISMLKTDDEIKKCYAFDISQTALDYTRENARLNGVEDRLEAIEYDVMGGDFPDDIPSPSMIISNPPYIRADEMAHLPENVRHEPRIALLGGADGCDFYRKILADFSGKLPINGCILFEIAPGQKEILEKLFRQYGLVSEFFEDYHGNIRVACGKKKKSIDFY